MIGELPSDGRGVWGTFGGAALFAVGEEDFLEGRLDLEADGEWEGSVWGSGKSPI